MEFSKKLITWFEENQRDLPWRATKDPYKIWLSEIILQQTRVTQGMPYYESFVEAFPTVQDLANAPEEQIMRLWQGLGYYSRARNLHQTAKIIVEELGGAFPKQYQKLVKLKGIGPYTAAAIASFAFQENIALVDGNVYRVLSRIFGITTDIGSSKAYKEFFELASSLIDPNQPDTFNQAIMEFGALQCTPKNPNCTYCPFQPSCVAFQTGKTTELPIKTKKTKTRKRHLLYIVWIDAEENVFVQQRKEKDIWQHLYEFDAIETDENFDVKKVKKVVQEKAHSNSWSINTLNFYENSPIIHKLTHQTIEISFVNVFISEVVNTFVAPERLQELGLPIVLRNYWDKIHAFENHRYPIAAEPTLRKHREN